MLIKYEDLTSNTEQVLIKILNFIHNSINKKYILDENKIKNILKTTSFDYYESILSPNITATMTFVDTGGSVGYPQEYDRQERVGSIYNALPITGGEKVKFKIKHPLGTLDFSTDEKALLVNSALNPDQESQRETVILSLFSQIAKTNQESKTVWCECYYPTQDKCYKFFGQNRRRCKNNKIC